MQFCQYRPWDLIKRLVKKISWISVPLFQTLQDMVQARIICQQVNDSHNDDISSIKALIYSFHVSSRHPTAWKTTSNLKTFKSPFYAIKRLALWPNFFYMMSTMIQRRLSRRMTPPPRGAICWSSGKVVHRFFKRISSVWRVVHVYLAAQPVTGVQVDEKKLLLYYTSNNVWMTNNNTKGCSLMKPDAR